MLPILLREEQIARQMSSRIYSRARNFIAKVQWRTSSCAAGV